MNTTTLPTRFTSAVRTPEVAVGALIIALCVVGAMAWGRSAVSGTSVLVVKNDVRKGAVLDADDLSTITLTSSDDIALVRASSLNDAVGRRAAVEPTAFEVWDISEPDPLDATRVVTLKVDIDLATTLLGREEIRLMKVNG
ncbi:MAG: hypothetical protein EB010_01735 [Acidimicrobiia bacterium]|nr:hypothetical protein [Acidimicrobiia bacterium]